VKNYGVNELRKMFLEYFESKGHLKLESFSLVPNNDNSLLLINSGMAPLKPYFTGKEVPPKNRVTTCQKCVRTGDIENVGLTARHLTFFEMLGNFSFGDYFKKEAIEFSWEFLTKKIGMDPERLYPSIYFEDEESYEIWTNVIGIEKERIVRFYRDENGACDNFWEHGAGPCGPCSEIYYDRGEKYGCGSKDCKVGCDCDRYMEVWNNVFTQYNGDGKGNYTELSQKNIDTGMGLERLAVVVQDVDSVFDIDTMKTIRDSICKISNVIYKKDKKNDISIRLITDHIRSATFMISDGIMPTNEGRGYVLRRLIRRAARHGKLLGIEKLFLSELSQVVINESKDGYKELEEKSAFILNVLSEEEKKFNKTIDQGLSILSQMELEMIDNNEKLLSGENAFKLHDTYGFPIDLTREILEEKGFSVDEKAFEQCMQEQKDKARDARKETNYMGTDATIYEELDASLKTSFKGYTSLNLESEIIALTSENEILDVILQGNRGTIITKETPFYATMGGQAADNGLIRSKTGLFKVEDTIKLPGDKIGHVGIMQEGMFRLHDVVNLIVSQSKREDICKNHSATHLLQKALRSVLGEHVEQAGSFVTEKRLRFDFSHFTALTNDEINQVEKIVNENIFSAWNVLTEIMSIDEAKKTGAMALFGEKYTDEVRVVRMGDFSMELCGGTHVTNTSQIGMFKIVSETGIAAGVRRIEALTGYAVLAYYKEIEDSLCQVSELLKTSNKDVISKVESLLSDLKAVQSENESLKSKIAKEALGDVSKDVEEINGLSFIAQEVNDVDMNGLRELGDQLKDSFENSVIVLASTKDGKVNLLVMASKNAIEKGVHAGQIVKQIAPLVGGGGGGRENTAQAGGTNPKGIFSAFTKAKDIIIEQIS